MASPSRGFEPLSSSLIDALRRARERFPAYVRTRGADYFHRRRVGSIELRPDTIQAKVYGTRTYKSGWRWNGHEANPQCSCPVGPFCKHSYALALAVLREHDRGGAVETTWTERPSSSVATELEEWAHRHTTPPSRSLRVVLGLEHRDDGPGVVLEARVTSPRLKDQTRSQQQIAQMAYDAQGGRHGLSPPQARLARLLAERVRGLRERHGHTIEVPVVVLNQLLDAFPSSPFVTWGAPLDPDLAARAGVVAGARARLEDGLVDVAPVCQVKGEAMRISLAVRWADGRQRTLDQVVYLQSHDDLHPSLVLAGGGFWRVNEEPPRALLLRLAGDAGVEVPIKGRERFLELLAASFDSVAEALAPLTRVHRAHPIVVMELSDWLSVRLYAAPDPAWRPGQAGGPVFALDGEGRWERLTETGHAEDALVTMEPGRSTGPSEDGGGGSSAALETGGDWLLDMPDPESVRVAREWLAFLPLVPERKGGALASESRLTGWMRIDARSLDTLAEAWDRRPRDVTYIGNGRMRELLAGAPLRARVRVTASGVDWFSVRADWEAEGRALTEEDLARLRSSRSRFVKLSTGWVRRERVAEHDQTAELLADMGIEVNAGEQRLTLWQVARARPESLAALESLETDTARQIRELRERVGSFAGLPAVPVPDTFRGELRHYQKEGLDFLAYVTGLGLGAILADDMGLGKTIQALAWIEHARQADPAGGAVLVVCPASVVHNWIRESQRFLPHLRVLALTSGHERHALRQEISNVDLVVTNYALVRRDLADWRNVALRAVILDEAQNIKNPDAAVSRAVQQLQCRHRMALTGTPLENRALDLWSIMQFVNPGYLGSRKAFVARYDAPDAPPYRRRLLAARLRPMLLRRLKSQVALELPDRIEEQRDCELTTGQRKLYLLELERGRALMARLITPREVQQSRLEILSVLTRLRQICCHPALAGGKPSLGSGKFDAVFELLEPLLAEGHKVLLFSQFVECLKLLDQEMEARGIGRHMLTGSTTRREEVVTAFESDSEPCVFLISLRAGGTGLNLTAASYVVLFDPWWNPAVEAQAIDRTHRIGQTRTVIAYRMLASGTIEEKIWELQQRKAALASDVLGEEGFARTLDREALQYLFEEE
ncbi:MAG TPA: DEAD/DEAH box helicase [Candidatus Eisenbacteria bacterium]|nr:DEAD/DEAH box helicase [Candidatus Eisenbacteria bacterium]